MHTGIDPGLAVTAIVTLDHDGTVLFKEHFGGNYNNKFKYSTHQFPAARYRLYHDEIIKYFESNSITGTVVLEDAISRVYGNGRKLIELKGVYLVALSQVAPAHKIFTPSPTAIKKSFVGYGSASKDDMIKECKKRGILPRHDHEADAIGMAFMSIEGKL